MLYFKLISFLLIIHCANVFGSLKAEQYLPFDLAYVYDKADSLSAKSICDYAFIPVQKIPFNNGLKNGTYWFKIKVHNTDYNSLRTVFDVHEPYINTAFLYYCSDDSLKLLCETGNKFELASKPISCRCLTFPVVVDTGIQTYIVKVRFHRNTSFILDVQREKDFYLKEVSVFFKIGIYYGISLMIIIVNLFYFFSFKDKTFLFYAITVFLICCSLLHLDGLMVYVFKPGWFLINVDIVFHILLAIACSLFSSSYLGVKIHLPKQHKIELILLSIVIVIYLLFLITNNVILYAMGIASILLFLSYYWVLSLILFKIHKYARFYSLAYVVMLFTTILYAIPVMLGHDFLRVGIDILKIGCILEMLIMSYAVVFRLRVLKKENKHMTQKIKDYICKIEEVKANAQEYKENASMLLCTSGTNIDFALIKEEYNLTEREVDVLKCIIQNYTNPKIAEKLFISVNTVKYHTQNIYSKLNISGRTDVLDQLLKVHT